MKLSINLKRLLLAIIISLTLAAPSYAATGWFDRFYETFVYTPGDCICSYLGNWCN